MSVTYYISQQNGNDANDGLIPETAWASFYGALNSLFPTSPLLEDITIYVAPGIYRETIELSELLGENRVVFEADPCCLYFPNDNQGIVRISGLQEDETTPLESLTSTNYCLITVSDNVKLLNLNIDSPYHGIIGGTIENCKIWSGLIGAQDFVFAKNCEIYSGTTGLVGISTTESEAYNCICYSATNGFATTSCYHCFSISANISFTNCTSYNCIAQYSLTGFSGGTCYNCIASNCQNGFTSTAGSNRKSIGCSANTGDSPGSAFYFLPEIKTIVSKGLTDKGTPIVDNTADILGLERDTGNGLPDIGPIENCDYSLNYDDFYVSAPSVQINKSGQLSFTFRVNKGTAVIKQVTVKHANTASSLKPQVVIRGLGIELTKTVEFESDLWETLTFSFVAPVDGVMEVILYARDSNEDSYSLFANFI